MFEQRRRDAASLLKRVGRTAGLPEVIRRTREWRLERRADLPPRPPDYVGVGAQRGGTSWWHALMLQHPDVVGSVTGEKELHYFDRFADKAFEPRHGVSYGYNFAFDPALCAGEWTPRYMFDEHTLGILATTAPDAKILVLLRDPIERVRSGLAYAANRHYARADRELAEAIARSMYSAQIERVFAHFARDQVLVLQHEACAADPETAIRETYAFLGVDPTFVPSDISRSVNRAATALDTSVALDPTVIGELRADAQRTLDLVPDLDPALWPTVEITT